MTRFTSSCSRRPRPGRRPWQRARSIAAALLPPQALVALRRNPNVAHIEQDRLVSLHRTEQTGATWGLDRIDQRDLPLDEVYRYSSDGTGVNVYVIDSGILYGHTGIGSCVFDDPSILHPKLTCTDNGTYTVTLTVSNGVDTAQDSATVTVANVAPSVEAGPDDVLTSGATFDFSGTFSDPGVIDYLWAYEIDWGDGATTAGSTSDQSSAIQASHQVCAPGVATVGLTVTDKDGGMGSDSLQLTVEYYVVDIQITPDQNPNPIRLRQRGRLPVAAFSTPTFDATTLDVTTITLGNEDGNDTPVAQRRNGTYFTTYEDVNGDGLLDLVMQFEVPALVANGDLTIASTELVLIGTMNDACTQVRGSDHVTVVPR